MNSNLETKNEDSIWEKFKEILDEIPFFIRFVLIMNIFLFILNLFTKYTSFYLSNIPFYTLSHYQFWRLITTSFITTNIVNMLIGFLVWVKDAISLERSLGTIRYILIFIGNSIFINIIYCLIISFINHFLKIKIYNNYYGIYAINNSGIWPIIICEMTLLCLNNPDSKIIFLFRPCPIKAKYYPIFIIIIFTLVNNFRINYAIISGFLYGIIYYHFLQNKFNCSDEIIRKIENSFVCKCLTRFNGFINIDSINHNYASSGDVHMISSLDNISSHIGFSPFGGKGVSVGSSDYVAVNEQNQNNALDEINTGNKN